MAKCPICGRELHPGNLTYCEECSPRETLREQEEYLKKKNEKEKKIYPN